MFKKIALGVAAASVLAVPATAAPFNHNGNFGHNGRGQVERVVKSRQVTTYRQAPRFRVGQRFDRGYATNYRVIQNPRAYRLREAPRGYRWVQNGNDAVLVGLASGLIGALIANAF
jgi:Ni/Co efflux regulator RcnB